MAGFNIIYSTFTMATLLQEVNFQNSTAVTVAAVPTGACNVYVDPSIPNNTCALAGGQTFGGKNTLANNSLPATSLNWDPTVSGNPTLNGGKVFPNPSVVVPSCTASKPCNIMAVDPNLTTPYVTTWNLGVTHAFNNNLSLEVEYVGNHGSRLTGFRDLNQPNSDGSPNALGVKFPYLGFINQFTNDVVSNYNGLQTTLTQRVAHGFSYTLGYTYSHGLDNGSLNRNGFLPQDSNNPMLDYASGDFDMRHRFTITPSYSLPGVKGYAQLLEGWKVNAIISLQTGQPWTVWDQGNNFGCSFTCGENTDRWNFAGNPADFKSQGANSIPYCTGNADGSGAVCNTSSGVTQQTGPNMASSTAMWQQCLTAVKPFGATALSNMANSGLALGCFVNGSGVMTPPATGSFGNMPRNYFRDTGFHNVDFSVFKTFTFKERYTAEFRAEFFNVFNTPEYANPYGSVAGYGAGNDPGTQQTTFGCGCTTPDVMAGNPLVGSGSARTIQFGLKLGF